MNYRTWTYTWKIIDNAIKTRYLFSFLIINNNKEKKENKK